MPKSITPLRAGCAPCWFLLLATCVPLLQAQTQAAPPAVSSLPAEIRAKVDQSANQILAASQVPSASIAVVKDGQVVYLKAYGMARLSPPMQATPQMHYSIGSVSKQFTAAAVLLLVQEGKLTLDDPVAKYLPDLTRAGEVTIRMLLSHTSGYQDYWPEDYVMTSMMKPTTGQQILDVWAKKPLDFDPGTRWQYSNTNYVIAGRIVEQASGTSLIDLLDERIFVPLHMTDVYNSDASQLPPTDPTGYERYALGPARPSPLAGAGWMFAAGELAMTPQDLALWDISIMNRSLLRTASYDQMFAPVMLKDGTNTEYALGLSVGAVDGHPFLEHSGEVSGFVSENVVYPADHAAIVVLTNSMASQAAKKIANSIEPLLLGAKETPKDTAETQALAIWSDLADGHINRQQFTDYCNAYFNQLVLDDFAASLKPLGPPLTFTQTKEELRGGMTFHVYKVTFPDRELRVTTYVMPDGKLEQYLVIP